MKYCWAIAAGLVIGVSAVQAADPASEAKTGLKVGEKAPEFKLQDQAGQGRTLSTLLKDGPVALVFYRSASW